MNDPVPTAAAAEREVFAAAAALAPEERATFLEEACAGRSELRVQVEQWLRTHESSGFMEAAGEHARPLAEAAGERIGRYELIERIGEGGFGVVWMAEQREPVRRRVALKIIKLGMDTREVVARFEQERQALALMDHPHIAKVFDAGATPAGRPFFVMELVRGVKISDYCDEARLTTEERLGLFIAVCQAVQHAHQKGIIHRDLKPSNILVAVQDGVPVPKVIDFGVAKAIEGRLTDLTLFTQREQLIGTPIYMSPEQAESGGVDIDTRSDIYSLGVMLYELLTGRTPVDRETLARAGLDEVRRIIREQEPPRPSLAARPAHPIATDLDWIAMKALEKDRTRRYDSAAALAEDVRRHLHDEPVSAGRPGVLYRGRKWVRRHKVPAAIAGILILTALAVLTLSIRHAAQMKEQRDYAQSQERRAESVLQREQLLRAEDFLHRHDVSAGLAYLAHVLRREPGDVVTASRLLSAIVDRSHFLPLFAPIPHESAITQVEFTPDGRRIFSADQRQAWMWDAESGRRLLGPVRYAGDSPIIRASLSPDGRRFVLTGIDSQVFDSETGTPVTSLLAHPGRPRGSLWAMTGQFSPDGSTLATISTHHKVCLWNVATSQLLCPPLEQGGWPFPIAFSPDGKLLAVGVGGRGRVLLWDVATGEKLADWPAPEWRVLKVIFTRDGQRLFVVTDHAGGAWFDLGTRKQLWPTLKLAGRVNAAALSADEKTVITCSHDGAIRHWDAASGQAIGGAQEHGKGAWMQLSRDGEKIASVTDEPQLWLWDRTSSVPLIAPRRLSAKITAVNFSPDAQRLVAGTADGRVTVFQAALIGARPLVFPAAVKGYCEPAMNPEGALVLTGDGDVITRWDAQTARPLLPTLEHSRDLQRLAFSPDGSRFVSGTLHGPPSARVWDAPTAKPVTAQLPASGYAVSFFLSDDNKLLGVIGQDQTADVWNVETGQRVAKGLGKNTQKGEFGGHGRWLLVMMDTTAAVWDLAHGAKEIGAATSKSDLVHVAASPAGDCFATASQDGMARVWSFDPVRALSPPLVHRGPVPHVSFSPDGKLLATASADGTARIWDWAAGRMLTEPLPHREALSIAMFSPDGRRVATAAVDRTVRIWDVTTGRPLTEALFTPGKTRVFTPGRPYGLQWSADGRRLFAKCYGGAHPLWQLLEVTAPAPPWLADWAEALGGQRLDESGRLLDVGFAEYQRFRERAASLAGSDVYGESLRWFFAPGPARPIAPGSRVTAQDQPAQPQ